ncbi:hypothetical protein C8J57DRAFT_607696 [Mycena rebaudengoi]|nr:hypothetical protein C8J57DRAFT_607696 [Mycena rebaudengoi]
MPPTLDALPQLLLLLLALHFLFAIPYNEVLLMQSLATSCHKPAKRQEWRDLRNQDKARYISAVKCLQSLPANGPIKEAASRFDDFQAIHIILGDEVHKVFFLGTDAFLTCSRRL